jgi:hypothetical protein
MDNSDSGMMNLGRSARWTSVLGAAGLLGIGLAAGCGGGDEPPPSTAATAAAPTGPVDARGGRQVEAEVGPPGGRLTLEGGAILVIPEGALTEPTAVRFSAVDGSQAIGRENDQEGIGPALMILPAMRSASGQPFELRVPFLTLPSGYDREDLALATEEVQQVQRAMGMGGTQTRWFMNPARIEGDEVVGEVDTLSGHRVQFVVSR